MKRLLGRATRRAGLRPGTGSTATAPAEYARLLDGDTLCLALREVRPGERVALRERETGTAVGVDLVEEGTGGPPDGLAGRVDLRQAATLLDPARERVVLEVVLVEPGRRRARTVEVAEPTGGAPRPVRSTDGSWLVALRDDGALRVAVRPAPPVATVAGVGMDGAAVVLTVTAPAGTRPEALEFGADDEPALTVPVRAEGGGWTARFDGAGAAWRLGVTAEASVRCADRVLPLHRAWSDLTEPGSAVALPVLDIVADGVPAHGRLGYRPNARLVLRPAPVDDPGER